MSEFTRQSSHTTSSKILSHDHYRSWSVIHHLPASTLDYPGYYLSWTVSLSSLSPGLYVPIHEKKYFGSSKVLDLWHLRWRWDHKRWAIYRKVSFFGLSVVFNVLIFMKILILISLDTYSYQSKQIRTPSSLSGVIVACPSRSNSSLPSILADTYLLVSISFPLDFSFHMLMIPQ